MPPPEKPSGTAGLSADEIAEIDPDYLYFLRHVRPEGRAYAVEIPSKDGSFPPRVVRYEKPLAALPSASSEGGTRGTSCPMEDDLWAGVEAPSGAASPSAGPSGGVPVDWDSLPSPKVEPAWYDSLTGVDQDYLIFLKHCREVNDSQVVVEMGNFSMTIGEEPFVGNCEDDDEDEDEEDEEDGVDEVETVSTTQNDVEEKKPVVAGSKWPVVKVSEILAKVKEEVDDSVKIEEDDNYEGADVSGSDLQLVNVMEFEEQKMKVEVEVEVDEDEEPEPEPSNREASSRQGHSSMPHNASEVEGVIWPAHIIERPESNFKRKLMNVLAKPFTPEEYDKLFAAATDRTPEGTKDPSSCHVLPLET